MCDHTYILRATEYKCKLEGAAVSLALPKAWIYTMTILMPEVDDYTLPSKDDNVDRHDAGANVSTALGAKLVYATWGKDGLYRVNYIALFGFSG